MKLAVNVSTFIDRHSLEARQRTRIPTWRSWGRSKPQRELRYSDKMHHFCLNHLLGSGRHSFVRRWVWLNTSTWSDDSTNRLLMIHAYHCSGFSMCLCNKRRCNQSEAAEGILVILLKQCLQRILSGYHRHQCREFLVIQNWYIIISEGCNLATIALEMEM